MPPAPNRSSPAVMIGRSFARFVDFIVSITTILGKLAHAFMTKSKQELWNRFQGYYVQFPTIQMAIDISRMDSADDYLVSMEPRMEKVFLGIAELETGGIANTDEKRMLLVMR
jgi:hypothetical protein